MKKRIVQIRRHSVCYFFMLTSIGCSKLSDQLGVEAKAHTSATAVSNKSVRKSVNAQRESEVVAIPKMQTWLTVMMILSQVQPAVGNGNAAFCSNLQSWKNKYTAFLRRRSDVSSFFNDFYAFYCDAICEEYAQCINFITNKTSPLKKFHIPKIRQDIEHAQRLAAALNKQPSRNAKDKEIELNKLRTDRSLLLNIFSKPPEMSTSFPLCSNSLYFDICSKNGQDLVYDNYAGCASSVCYANRCAHNGESHRVKRDRVIKNSQKAESSAQSKRPTRGKSYRENPFFSKKQSYR